MLNIHAYYLKRLQLMTSFLLSKKSYIISCVFDVESLIINLCKNFLSPPLNSHRSSLSDAGWGKKISINFFKDCNFFLKKLF